MTQLAPSTPFADGLKSLDRHATYLTGEYVWSCTYVGFGFGGWIAEDSMGEYITTVIELNGEWRMSQDTESIPAARAAIDELVKFVTS